MRARLVPAFLLTLSCLAASPAEAKPVAVTLYPSGALVTEEERVTPQDGRILLTLPAKAHSADLVVALSQGSVLSRSTHLVPGSPAPAVARLQNSLERLHDAMSLKQAELANASAMRDFWSQPPYSLSAPSVEMANSLMEIFSRESGSKLADIAQEEARLHDELRALQKQANVVEARIRALGKENADTLACQLNVKDTGTAPVTVRWTYWLDGAHWAPQYRLTADTEKKQLSLRMDAAVFQNSGVDWNGVEVTLASAEKLRSTTPPALRPWVIGESVHAPAQAVLMKSARMTAANDSAVVPSMEAAGLLWKPGRMDAASGDIVTRLLSEHVFPVEMRRLMRPSRSADAWIEAVLPASVHSELPLLPSGEAVFLVDGVENARGFFRFGPDSRVVSLGVDQLIRAEVNQTSGTAAPADNGTTVQQWAWHTTIHSAHDKPVSLRVEEPAPIARQADVTISVSASPEAVLDADTSRYVWELELPAGTASTLNYEVKATFPNTAAFLKKSS